MVVGGAIIPGMVSKAAPLQKEADRLAHGLFTFTSVNPGREHYSKQASCIRLVFAPARFCLLPLDTELGTQH